MYEQFSFLSQSNRPLAERVRPTSLDEFIGQEEAVGKSSVLRREIAHDSLSSMILWGPPGCGKTTVVHIISNITQAELYKLSAISAGVKEIKEILQIGKRNHLSGLKTILFLDEIHRLNKAQQDVLLADVEQGNVVLIGATTENPSFEINKALLSRTRVVVFLNDPTLSEQMVVSCLDWVGLFFACNPCVSRAAGFFNLGHHMSPASGKQFKIRVQNV